MAGGVVAVAAVPFSGDNGVSSSLLSLVHDISRTAPAAGVFKKDCTDLARRVALLAHLFEEMRDFKAPLAAEATATSSTGATVTAYPWWSDLLASLQAAKRLLSAAATFGSDAFSDEAAKKIAFQFQCVTWKLEKTLGNLPYNDFDISEEVQEQVGLVRAQLKRATARYGPCNARLSPRALSVDKNLDLLPSSNRVNRSLHIENVGFVDCQLEAKRSSISKSNGLMSHNADQMTRELERPRNFAVFSEACKSNEVTDKEHNLASKSEEEAKRPDSDMIPDDFLCPISLELMRDPVIVATGQTYERAYIQRWIDSGNVTCPKTQQKLRHLTLTPNYVLRSLITQWCTDHNIEQPMTLANGRIKRSDGSLYDVSEDIAAIEALVHKLSSGSIEDQRSAVTEIRSLSKRSTDNRILIAEAGAIPVLVNLLTAEDLMTQENAVTSILNLSIYENNKGLIMLAGAVPSIVQILRAGSMEARENAAATLFSLSLADENKIIIGASGAIPALVDLLQNGSARGKKDAATALFNLCIYQGNKGRAVRAGIVAALLKMLTDGGNSMVDEALTILSVLACNQEAKNAIVKASTIPVLIDLLRTGLPRSKENATAILLSLCKRENENLASLSRLGAAIPLTELAKSGTERAKRKATTLLEHLRKLQQ